MNKEKTKDSPQEFSRSLSGIERELHALNEQLKKRNSFGRMLLSGLLTGLGTVIGATIIAGAVLYSLYKIAEATNTLELLRKALESAAQ